MSTIVLYNDAIRLPDGINTLAAFRGWLRSDSFPEAGRISYLRGQVRVDMSKEQLFTHNQVKQEFNLVIGGLVKNERLGRYWFIRKLRTGGPRAGTAVDFLRHNSDVQRQLR